MTATPLGRIDFLWERGGFQGPPLNIKACQLCTKVLKDFMLVYTKIHFKANVDIAMYVLIAMAMPALSRKPEGDEAIMTKNKHSIM